MSRNVIQIIEVNLVVSIRMFNVYYYSSRMLIPRGPNYRMLHVLSGYVFSFGHFSDAALYCTSIRCEFCKVLESPGISGVHRQINDLTMTPIRATLVKSKYRIVWE